MNIGTLLTRHALYRPDHPAFAFGDARLTHRDLDATVYRLCHAVLGAGLGKGDKFAKFQRLADPVLMEGFPRNIAGTTLKREPRSRCLAG